MNCRPLSLLLLGSFFLSSCSSLNDPKSFTPNYLKEDSNLDKPGVAAARAAERAKRKKDGAFTINSEYALQGGKVFLFKMNPEYSESASGKNYEAKSAKVIFCEGTYYFVELDTKERGYIQATSMINPIPLMSELPLTMDGVEWGEVLPISESMGINSAAEPLFPDDATPQGVSTTPKPTAPNSVPTVPSRPAPAAVPSNQEIPDLPASSIQ